MSKTTGELLDNKRKYHEIKPSGIEPMICWSLNGNWYVEGELYDELNIFEQRKVISNFAPGDFSNSCYKSIGFHLHARSDHGGDCYMAP